jgi:hypothetical protein
MAQTAVEFLEDKLSQVLDWDLIKLFEQAKAMERKQIITSFATGFNQNVVREYKTAEEYYSRLTGDTERDSHNESRKSLLVEIMDADEEDDIYDICPVCNGTGEGPADGTICWKCKNR